MIFGEETGDLTDFAKLLGIDLEEEVIKPKKKTENQKAADELSKMLRKYGSNK